MQSFSKSSTAFCAIVTLLLLGITTPVANGQSIRETVETVQTKVVKIFGAGGFSNLKAYGTGFLVSPEGHIVTVWSSVLDSSSTTVILDNGQRFQAKVLGAEPTLDVAVIKIEAKDLPFFDLDKAVQPRSGIRVFGFSNMFKVATGNEPVSVLRGIVSSVTKLIARRGSYEIPYDGRVMIIDAITNNSGGAGGVVTSLSGELLGMIGRELKDRRSNLWINYSTPVVDLKATINAIITGKLTEKPKSKYDPLNEVINYKMTDFGVVMVPNVVVRTPAFVDTVLSGTEAAKAGLQPDDLILFVNDELISSIESLRKIVGKAQAGDLLRITYKRGTNLNTAEWAVVRKESNN